MPENHFEELRTACRASSQLSDEKMLDIGETLWLMGHPEASDEDTVALRTGRGQKVVIREKDVIEVKKRGSRYLVRVKTGTNLIFKLERVIQARLDSTCECGGNSGKEPNTTGVSARQEEGGGQGSFGADEEDPPGWYCYWDCHVGMICLPDPDGPICVTVLRPPCTKVCVPLVA
jgi:hypothetical protein